MSLGRVALTDPPALRSLRSLTMSSASQPFCRAAWRTVALPADLSLPLPPRYNVVSSTPPRGGDHVDPDVSGAVPQGGLVRQAGLPAPQGRGNVPAYLDGRGRRPGAARRPGPRGPRRPARRPRRPDGGERPALADRR